MSTPQISPIVPNGFPAFSTEYEPESVDESNELMKTPVKLLNPLKEVVVKPPIHLKKMLEPNKTYKVYFKDVNADMTHMGDYKYNGPSQDNKSLSFTCILDNCDDGVSVAPLTKEPIEPSFWKRFTTRKSATKSGHVPLLLPMNSIKGPNPKYFFNDINRNATGVEEYVPYKGGKRKRKTFKRKTFKRKTFKRKTFKRKTFKRIKNKKGSKPKRTQR